jgi:hypothetical protein
MIALMEVPGAKSADTLELTPTENHHIVELNSNQPYVAGFHVNTPDLNNITRGSTATAITISFPSTNPSCFPPLGWLGAGMFVQAQDSRYLHVDYAFYTMLALDAADNMFVDVGLHQTREDSPPLQMPPERLVYAYTWQVSGVDRETPVTLSASWDPDGWVHYSVYASGHSTTLPPVNVANMAECENIIRKFYAGNVRSYPFPLGCQVQFFQFGVVSSESFVGPYWFANLKEPRFFRNQEWHTVDTAWSIEGDGSYLDSSWMWGGRAYKGVSALYHQHPLGNLHEVVFFYNGQTLPYGTILWQSSDEITSSRTENSAVQCLPIGATSSCLLGVFILILIARGKLEHRRPPA